jgi:Fic family protein
MFPKVTYKEYVWTPRIDLSDFNVWQRLQIEKPYKAAVLKPIAAVNVSIDNRIEDLYNATIESVVRFDAELAQKSIAMPAILLRSESASSSQIEHLSASAKNIAMAELGYSSKSNATVIAGNIRSMKNALEQTDVITEEAILNIHRILLENTDPEIAGIFRDEQVWIGGRGISPHNAAFVPPHQENIAAYLMDLIEFINRKDIHGLLQASIAHCQFETIHPFLDGNGRTGRALMQAMLHNSGLIRKSALPISAGLLSDIQSYFRALESYREGDITPITEQICKAALDAVEISRRTVNRFESLRNDWNLKIKARRDAVVWRMLELLMVQPIVDVKYTASHLHVTDPAARNAIDQLLSAGILKKSVDRNRNVLYEAHEVVKLTDSFATEIARR